MMKKHTYKHILVSLVLTLTLALPASTLATPRTTRLSGMDRYETAAAIAAQGWTSADNAVLCFGENYPDALSAVPLAKALGAPVLLTFRDILPESTLRTLTQLKVKNVVIVGGTGVVSKTIETKLQALGLQVQRLAGKDRYDTAVKVAAQVTAKPTTLFVAYGGDYPDALSAAPVAALNGMPVILVPKFTLPDPIKDYLTANPGAKTYIMGGTDVITDFVAQQFPNSERITGEDKYSRNIGINEKFASLFKGKQLCLATGESFADALTGAAFAARISEPIILVNYASPAATKAYYQKKTATAETVVIFGGQGALPEAAISGLSSTAAPVSPLTTPAAGTGSSAASPSPAYNPVIPENAPTIIWYSGDNKGTYTGPLSNEVPNGEGIWTGYNGDKRVGSWSNGKEHGYGVYAWSQDPRTGNTYEGNWSGGTISGQGTLTYANGDKYIGSFYNGKKNGAGTYYYANGAVYEGVWRNEYITGQGLLTVNNTTYPLDWGNFSAEKIALLDNYNAGIEKAFLGVYIGEEKDNLPNGIGYWLGHDRGRTYVGNWLNGKRQGLGIYIWPLGEKYDGNWANGDLNGLGTYTWTNGDSYTGQWENGKANGPGKETYANGDIYDGQWKNGVPHGQGQKKYANGDIYEGQWENGIVHGQGIYTWSKDGKKYIGSFVNGSLYQGTGAIYDKSNRVLEYVNGNVFKPGVASVAEITQTVEQGDNYSLPATVETTYMDGIKKQVSVTWTPASPDTSKIGTYTFSGIIAETTDLRAKATLTINPSTFGQVKSITLNKTTLTLAGGSETLLTTIVPSNARNQNITWKSSNVSVATVDSLGRVTAIRNGTANITATTQEGNKSAICEVTVTNMPNYLFLNTSYRSANGLTVMMERISKSQTITSNKYAITYTLINESTDTKQEEKHFKMHFTNGDYLNQSATTNNYLDPLQVVNRSYEFEVSKGRTPYMIEFDADFFDTKPQENTLRWKIE